MKNERKDDSFIKQPYYLGGDKALKEFVNTNLRYPETSISNKIEGHVNLRYEINHKGIVTDVKIISGLDQACNDEAIRVVKLLKFEVPKTPRGLKVLFHKNIRIQFDQKTNEISQVPQLDSISNVTPTNYQYQIVSNTNPIPKEKPTTQSYQYTIKMG
jgi:protein TonB